LRFARRRRAQQPKKVTRIGYLSSQDPGYESARAEGIRLALRELGYIEGQNIAIEYRYSEGKTDRAAELAAELVRLNVDDDRLDFGDSHFGYTLITRPSTLAPRDSSAVTRPGRNGYVTA
jgi:hypothetical protein